MFFEYICLQYHRFFSFVKKYDFNVFLETLKTLKYIISKKIKNLYCFKSKMKKYKKKILSKVCAQF